MFSPKYSVIVCVNNESLFEQFKNTISKTTLSNYEILKIDNSDRVYNVPEALNKGISNAKGNICIMCHQDIVFPECWLDGATKQIEKLCEIDSQWGVVGVMGVGINGFFAGNIVDTHTNRKYGSLPSVVGSLDEVCLILRKDLGLVFDELLGGFHLYGADICLQTKKLGMKSYVIDAPFRHLSGGKTDKSFWEMVERLKSKWSNIKGAPNTIETTCGIFKLNDSICDSIEYYYKKIRRKYIRRLQGRHVKDGYE